ncbi:MAG: hypothetical protein AAGA62_05390 [Bacteroidota bacterium]
MRLPHLFFLVGLLIGFSSCIPTKSSTGAPVIIQLSALEDFTPMEKPDYVPAYQHEAKQALAVNAGKYKDKYAIAETVFAGPAGTYTLELTSLQETDGESTYVFYRDDKRIAAATNDPTTVDYQPQIHKLGKVKLKPGQRLAIAFNSHSNGKIPEGDAFAFSRGRWTGIKLTRE